METGTTLAQVGAEPPNWMGSAGPIDAPTASDNTANCGWRAKRTSGTASVPFDLVLGSVSPAAM